MSEEIEPQMFWLGRPVEELSREELLDALKTIGRAYHEHLESLIKSIQLMRHLNAAARERFFEP